MKKMFENSHFCKNPNVDDPNWIIILFVIYLDPFRVVKVVGFSLKSHFSGRSRFGKLVYATFWSHFEALNNIF
jgi:hypothetical protein